MVSNKKAPKKGELDGIKHTSSFDEKNQKRVQVVTKNMGKIVPPLNNNTNNTNNEEQELPKIPEYSDDEYLEFVINNHSIQESSKNTTINKVLSAVNHTKSSTIHNLLSDPHKNGPEVLKIAELHKRKNMFVGILSIMNYSGIKND